MIKIKNRKQLVEKGETEHIKKARRIAFESLEKAIYAVDPKKSIASKISLKKNILNLNTYSFDLKNFKNIYVVGGGKASGSMAEALEEKLGELITEGAINVPYGCKSKTSIIELQQASHPLPDMEGVEGTGRILSIAEKAKTDDLIICLISGGGSSLMVYPREGISITDKRKLTDRLLKCGADIDEINVVRKHLSGFKGGWLAKKAYPATILNIILSDVIGDKLDVIASGPTIADLSTFSDAHQVLQKYGLWSETPVNVREFLCNGESGLIEETPKPNDEIFKKSYSVIIGNNRNASFAACKYLNDKGLNTVLLTSTLEGEAKCAGGFLATIANEILTSGNPISKPAAIIVGGETTVKVTGKGKGGRNQELVLSAALRLRDVNDTAVVVASVGTDGIDGPTDAAGAIMDTTTFMRGRNKGLKPEIFLSENDCYHFFSKTGDLIVTGQTGTNVGDISLIIII